MDPKRGWRAGVETPIILFFSIFIITLERSAALKCYTCISIECPESQLFCETVKDYILSQLPELYYGYEGQKVPACPSPNDNDLGWDELRSETRHNCEAEKADDATCTLGRFRVTTEIFETGKNITSYGTAMGCAKLSLLKLMRLAVVKNKCDVSSGKSKFKHSLRHYVDIEHCPSVPDMCSSQDFCIPPHAAQVRNFDTGSGTNSSFPFTIVLGVFILLALAVIVLTFLAPFFNG